MRYRHSLRFRIMLSYLAVGGMIAPLLAGLMLYTIHELEERLIKRHVEEELEQFVVLTRRQPAIHSLDLEDMQAQVRLVTEPPAPGLAFVADLPPGTHEVIHDGVEYHAAIAQRGGRRYTVVYDVGDFHYRELSLFTVLVGGTLLSLYLAVWFGYWLSRRLIAPVTSLARQVAELRPDQPPQPLAGDYPADEVGDLARAFDDYRQRLQAFIQRERDFTAGVSHELRNPLAVIQSAAELLLDRPGLTEADRARLERIERAARGMGQSISTLLLLARETRPDQGPGEETDVAAVVEATLNHLLPLYPNSQVELRCRIDAQPRLAAPASAVGIVVGNLVGNALAYTPRGQVTVTLAAQRLQVEDSGVGIDPADRARLFERGFRGHNAPGPGSGLGLYIVKRLCERYGWQVSVDSRPGGGTRVTWRFTALTES